MRSPTLFLLAQLALAVSSVNANDKTTCGTATTLAPMTNTVLLPEQTISLCDSDVTQCSVSISAIPTVAAASPDLSGSGNGSLTTPDGGRDDDKNAGGLQAVPSGEQAASPSRLAGEAPLNGPAAPAEYPGGNSPSEGSSPSGGNSGSSGNFPSEGSSPYGDSSGSDGNSSPDGSRPTEGGQPEEGPHGGQTRPETGPGANEQPTGDYPGPGAPAPTQSDKDVAQTPAIVVVSAADSFQRASYMYQLISAACGLVACYMHGWLA
ncbi:hypothetical protein CMUS01_06635 [Colletotrichum musicola]|uniref:Uncharacterized protein n=1 Tax=Colletotrichum musicola TaxID=2175873 RepID=A0A8H6KKH1_9PEZI|nr:hypothetical protein CMUS01_06635 [Colletotrichum musicola]